MRERYGTDSQNVTWFCHICMNVIVLGQGEFHSCKPNTPPAGSQIGGDHG